MTPKKPKIIIVGGGISGSMAALSALSSAAGVSIFTTLPACRSRSAAISEGFNATLDTGGECDTPALHAKETLASGNLLAHRGAVEKMCSAAPALLNYFDRMGVMFERTSDGLIKLIRSTGSSAKRTAVAGLSTGHQIACVLDGKIRELALREHLKLFEGWEFLSLVLDDEGNCRGIAARNLRNGEIKAFASSAVIICAGGFEGIFGAKSTAPLSLGTALAVCYMQGAHLANPEFLAIHPFTIRAADKCRPIGDRLIGMGARVSAEKDTIDISDIDPDWLRRNFSAMMDFYARSTGQDPFETPMKVAPAVYKSLGGLWISEDHATNVPGLYSAGGAACLYHGSGILCGNELLASAHGGDIAGRSSAEYSLDENFADDSATASLLDASRKREEDLNAHAAALDGNENARVIKRELEEALASACLFKKDNAGLKQTQEKIATLKERFARARPADTSQWDNAEIPLMRGIKLEFELASAMVAASISRENKRGAFNTKVSWSFDEPHTSYEHSNS